MFYIPENQNCSILNGTVFVISMASEGAVKITTEVIGEIKCRKL